MERLFAETTKTGKPIAPFFKKGLNRGVILIRYADDFVVVAPSKEALEEHVIPKVEAFLTERGLSLSQEKTRVTTIDDGFSFLGFEARKFRDGKLLIRPDKAKVLAHLRAIKTYLDANKQTPAGAVVRELTPVIKGWSAYYRHACSTETFSYADSRIWRMLWQWARRRHPKKSATWVKARYFLRTKTRVWNFADAVVPGAFRLPWYCDTKITRHTKVKGNASPLDPDARPYWEARRRERLEARTYFDKVTLTEMFPYVFAADGPATACEPPRRNRAASLDVSLVCRPNRPSGHPELGGRSERVNSSGNRMCR